MDGEPFPFRVVAEPGTSGRITWKVGAQPKASGHWQRSDGCQFR